MSTAAFPGSYPTLTLESVAPASRRPRVAASPRIRRRPTMLQGMALESLGHAVEYLVDSRMHLILEATTPADHEAVRILMRLSREVFVSCPEVVPMQRRLSTWLLARLGVSRA